MTTKTEALYINQNGRVVCRAHGGSYLDSYLKAHPDATMFDTPLDNWLLLDDEERAEFPNISCEDC